MNTCCTCSTHAKTFSLGKSQTDLNPTRSPGEKLEFVEHVLGVLIDSRHGDGNPYQRLGEATVMTGHSQMFANVRLLSAAEIQTHLEFGGAHHRPFCGSPGNCRWLQPGFLAAKYLGFSPTLLG
ncbi:MAG: hypothetical protein IPO41_14740 [Acidobacteria bacterium]|nr:hypothetical protein [Acidobacteriota bacterium]